MEGKGPRDHLGNNMLDQGFLDKIDRRKKFIADLETLPFSQETISAWEIEQILATDKYLDSVIAHCDREINGLSSIYGADGIKNPDTYQRRVFDIYEEVFTKLVEVLDTLDIWSVKFSTGEFDEDENSIQDRNEDSIYYMTKSGVCLRLKTINLRYGIRRENFEVKPRIHGVIQPLNELVFFNGNGEISLLPKIGYSVKEYTTIPFHKLLNNGKADGDFHATIKIHTQDGKIVGIPEPKDIYSSHEGHQVNQIFFQR